jgi:HK97 gp10 family phage protein
VPSFGVQIVSDTVTPKLAAAVGNMPGAIVEMLDFAGEKLVEYAQRAVPVRTGFLRSSIGYTVDSGAFTLNFLATALYAMYVEMGTRRMRPEPYMRPALDYVGLPDLLLEAVYKALGLGV